MRSDTTKTETHQAPSPRRTATLVLLLLLVFCPSALVLAHSDLLQIDPEDRAVVKEVDRVRLLFSESLELRFSTFKVYPLDIDFDADEEAIDRRAAELVSEVLDLRDDEAARADVGLANETGTSREVEIILRPDLPPGTYVTMWHILSTDSHTSSGFRVFTYATD